MVNAAICNAAICAAAVVLAGLAEWLHARRCARMARLAFGPAARPRRWVAAMPWLRAAAVGAVCWGLLILLKIDAAVWETREAEDKQPLHHLAIALDVSPSMQLEDAGPQGTQRRTERARDVLHSIFERLEMRRTRVSILAFYNGARPVVIDAYDPEVIANIIDDLPMEHAFTPGKTNMYDGVKLAAETAKVWPAQSAALIVISDGDTLPETEPPSVPAAYAGKLVIGVGNPHHGQFIDGHSSRQDIDSLSRLAVRLGGTYWDANVKHVPSLELAKLDALLPGSEAGPIELRDLAIMALLGGTAFLALLPLALALAGRRYVRLSSLTVRLESLTYRERRPTIIGANGGPALVDHAAHGAPRWSHPTATTASDSVPSGNKDPLGV